MGECPSCVRTAVGDANELLRELLFLVFQQRLHQKGRRRSLHHDDADADDVDDDVYDDDDDDVSSEKREEFGILKIESN